MLKLEASYTTLLNTIPFVFAVIRRVSSTLSAFSDLAKSGARLRVGEMQSGIIRQAAKKHSHFAIAAGFHRVGQLPKAGRRLLFEMDRISKKFPESIFVPEHGKTAV
jgi:hypothetical protein